MATKKSQRIGILIIAIVMTIGTLGSFFVIILANQNAQKDAKRTQALQEELQKLQKEKYKPLLDKHNKEMDEYNKKIEAEDGEIKKEFYDTLVKYEAEAAPFDKSKVKQLEKKDLKVGDGEEVKKPGDMRAFYVGWNTKGQVFDSSIDKEKSTLKTPIDVEYTINGWREGVVGMKIGGIRELTIPAELAYGSKGSGDKIPANEPLKFIIVAVKKPSEQPPKTPEMPKEMKEKFDELQKLNNNGYGAGAGAGAY